MTRTLGTAATLASLTLLGALTACSGGQDADTGADTGRDPSADGSAGTGAPTGDAEPAAAEPCPAELASDGTVPTEPAAAAPELPAATTAYVCRYQPAEVADGPAWERDGEPVEVDPAELSALDELRPAAADRFCTEELGPRWLVALDDGSGAVTGVVVDDFGCRDVTLTADPAGTAPGAAGQDVEGGVLTGPGSLAGDLATLYGG